MSNPLFQHDFGYQDSIFYDCVPTSQKYQQSKTNDAPHYLQLQKIVDDLHTAVQQFERLAFGPDCPKPMSILGKFSCLQSGCFFRCREYEDLLRHTDQGLHYKFKIDKFGDRDLSRTGDSYCLTVGAASTSGFELSGKKGAQKFDSLQINTQFSSAAVQNFFDCPKLPNDCNGVVLAVEDLQTAMPDRDVPGASGCHPSRIREPTVRRKRPDLKEDAKFECRLCSKCFTRASTLDEHSRTHNGERPFGCDKCPKRFSRLKDRNRHQTLHLGDKKFVCRGILDTGEEIGCHKSFAREDGLAAHLRAESVFNCLEPLLDTFAAHMVSPNNGDDGARKYCCHRPHGCGACFRHLKDLNAHLHSDLGKACIKPRLAAYAMSYLDHRRTKKSPPLVKSTSSESLGHQCKGTGVTKPPSVSLIASDITPTHPDMHPPGFYSDMMGFAQPLTVEGTKPSLDHGESTAYPFPGIRVGDRQHGRELEASEIEMVDGYIGSDECFKSPAIVEYAHYLGLKVEGYTPKRGVAGDTMQIKILSSVPLQFAVFSVRIGQLVETGPHLQRMNAIPASVQPESIALASFYRYTISAKVPQPRTQSQSSPVPIVLEIEGLRKYEGNMYELLNVGDFVYEEGSYDRQSSGSS